ncbi:MAG TPA: hypothetical protein VEJ36_02800 [Nitrososphaerales archaeon]|nr:hypothetical protein [Nitrososphaerales archaeon]
MRNTGLSSGVATFLVIGLIVAAGVGLSASMTQSTVTMAPTGERTSTSSDGLRLSLSVAPGAVSSGGMLNISISDYNLLATPNKLTPLGLPQAGGKTLNLGPCTDLPLGVGVYQGDYGANNVSQATPLQLFEPGVYNCPAEFSVSYYTFSSGSDNLSLYSSDQASAGQTNYSYRWSLPDSFSESVTGYWTSQGNGLSESGVFTSFSPGLYTVVGGDDWGQLAFVHFEVLGGTSTTSSTSTSPGDRQQATSPSVDGLQLRLTANSSVVSFGQSLGLQVSEFNTLNNSNNVSASHAWSISASIGPCANVYVQPFGVAVYAGHVESQNISQANRLTIYPVVPCPLFIRLVTGFVFQPESDLAAVLPGSSGVSPMDGNVTVSGVYGSPGLQAQPLPLGQYTVVAADEWGSMVFLYFTVV